MKSLQDAIEFFHTFTLSELSKDLSDEVRKYLAHKVPHSYGVLTSVQKIVALDPKLSATKTESKTEFEIAGLLHDIGRFTQHDGQRRLKESEYPHGEAGYDILKRSWLHNPRVLLAIKHHEKYDLRELDSELDYMMASTPEKEKILRICHLIRDADKLQNLEYTLFNPSRILTFSKSDSARDTKTVSDSCLEVIRKKQQLKKTSVETAAELMLYHFSWVFDIHHEGTKIALKQMRFRERFAEMLQKMWAKKDVIEIVRG